MSFWMWTPRKSAAQRRADAARKIKDAARRGSPMNPLVIEGRKIAHTFWGKAWCDNLERYQDFAYRLDRGRSYARSGSVIDLQIGDGKIAARVLGSSLYEVAIEIDPVAAAAWRAIQRDCAGSIGSLVDLLAGRLSEAVMARLCAEGTGLFPPPKAIRFTCTCPDYAVMCKHVAAAMYGVGARLDAAPELLFTLRRVSADDLLASAVTELPATRAPATGRVLADDGLAALFGIELAGDPPARGARVKRSAASAVSAPRRGARPGAAKGARALASGAKTASKGARAPASTAKTASEERKRGTSKVKPARARASAPKRASPAKERGARNSTSARRGRAAATTTRRAARRARGSMR